MGRRKHNVTWTIDPGPGGWWVCGVGYVKDWWGKLMPEGTDR